MQMLATQSCDVDSKLEEQSHEETETQVSHLPPLLGAALLEMCFEEAPVVFGASAESGGLEENMASVQGLGPAHSFRCR